MATLSYPPMLLTVRHPTPTEVLPDWTLDGQQFPKLDPAWVWLATQDWYTVGVLIAAPCHGIMHLLRVAARPGAPPSATLQLFRQCALEAKQRGYPYFMVTVDPLRPTESHLLEIAHKLGAIESGNPHVLAIGKIPEDF